MRASYLIVALGLVACGGTTAPPAGMHEQPAPGLACSELGATAPAEDGCNTCTCTEEGWSCTLLFCAPDACESGATKQADDGCNSCTCTDDGTWACTEMACGEPPCTPGETREQQCDSCVCADDGAWSCTPKVCGIVEPEPECTPGDTKDADDGCNTCHCSDDGRWGCTLVKCGDPVECPEPADVPDDVACPAVIAYGRSPTSPACCEYPSPCHVPEGWTAFNTEDECKGIDPGGEDTCEAGDIKDDGCNTCSCSDDGTWLCTLIACEETKGCGGWLGDTCTESEYCAYEEGQMCGAADASATCKPRPELCLQNYLPVCGCDGTTYGNACEAAASGTGVLASGKCANAE